MKRKIEVKQGASIFKAAIEAGVSIRTECGGNGVCGKCKVIVDNKNAVSELPEIIVSLLLHVVSRSGELLRCSLPLRQ